MRRVVKFSVMLLVLGLVLAGCDTDAGSVADTVALLAAPGVSGIAEYENTSVNSYSAAYDLFEAVCYAVDRIYDELSDANWEAFNDAFDKKYDKTIGAYMMSLAAGKSGSYSININDDEGLKTYSSTVTEGTIKGSNSGSMSLNNHTFQDYFDGNPLVDNGDSVSFSTSAVRTFDISKGYIQFVYGGKTYKLSGIIKTEYNYNGKETLTDKDNYVSSYNNDNTVKVSAAISVSDGTRGAKFRFSASEKWNEYSRSTGGNSVASYSDIEVYNNANTKIYTIKDYYDLWGWMNMAGYFTYNP